MDPLHYRHRPGGSAAVTGVLAQFRGFGCPNRELMINQCGDIGSHLLMPLIGPVPGRAPEAWPHGRWVGVGRPQLLPTRKNHRRRLSGLPGRMKPPLTAEVRVSPESHHRPATSARVHKSR